MLPGWYGFGAAIKAWLAARPDERHVRWAMHREWPFFAALLSNMDMVLAKSDIAIASRYAELVTNRSLRQAIFSRLSRVAGCRRDAALDHGSRNAFGRQSCSRDQSATGFHISIP